jgi:hypothetical protein
MLGVIAMIPFVRKLLAASAIALIALAGSPEGSAQVQQGQPKGQPVQTQQQGQQLQLQINQELERAKARQAFQRGITMTRNAEQRLLNLGESPEGIEVLRTTAGQKTR